jgi:hypothetical protein
MTFARDISTTAELMLERHGAAAAVQAAIRAYSFGVVNDDDAKDIGFTS